MVNLHVASTQSKRNQGGKDEQVERALKLQFKNVHDQMFALMDY